ncbi:MAG TPA: lysylphosphatidylglycerol synthase domain-containing protein, partial [Thermoanaerobaculia bacterium]|nr:lysylphosphatidylglycerol synthase domain-containing protein [Thermoanaerobaculia bacterium]
MGTANPAEASDGLIGRASARRWLRLALYAALVAMAAGGLVFLLTFDASALGELRRLGPLSVGALALLMVGTWAAGAARLVLLARSLGHPLSGRGGMAVAMGGEFGVAASPTGVGGTVLRIGLLRLYALPMTDATAVAGADLVIDAVVAVVFTLVALPLAFLLPGPRMLLEALAAQLAGHLAKVLVAVLLLLAVAILVWRWVRARRARRAARAAAASAAA